jgi:hypothetical protein
LASRLRELGGQHGRQASRLSEQLAEVRVVVYQFAARELSDGDWQLVELPSDDDRMVGDEIAGMNRTATEGLSPGETRAETKIQPPGPLLTQAGEKPTSRGEPQTTPPSPKVSPTLPVPAAASPALILVGEVLRASSLPRPFSAPYDDCLTTWLLRVENVVAGEYRDDTVLVVALGMENNVWLPAASVSPGDKRRLRLIPLKRASEAIRSTQRVDDTEDLAHIPYFALAVEAP